MSEYIEIQTELSDDGRTMYFYTNLALNEDGGEEYPTPAAMEEGSPLAQAFAVVDGIAQLRLEGGDITVTRAPDAPWHSIVADVTAALKDFFL